MGQITSITVDKPGQGYSSNPDVMIIDVWGTGTGAAASAVVIQGAIYAITVTSPGSGYSAPVVRISDTTGTGAMATPNMEGTLEGGIRKFVDSLPGLGASNANNLGNYMPIAIPDTVTYPGCDYYEIGLVRYTQQMSSDLPMTLMNGYVQLETPVIASMSLSIPLTNPDGSTILMPDGSQAIAVDKPSYMGPVIVSSMDIPVRIKFTNLLPIGEGGNLFLPVDTTMMGSGMGPLDMMGMPGMKENYTQNRATVHLHGGFTPWISDGTPHQWITPANEMTQYPKGVSVEYVPDMWFVNGEVVPNTVGETTPPVEGATNDPGDGSMTLYYTNQQSARLMFYHDHAYGITRLNVYSGEAAGYLLTDSVENALIDAGIIPSQKGAYLYGMPLVIQDKTFVDAMTIAYQDPTWAWGSNGTTPTTGDLWYPHVYMPNQNPYSPTGANDLGRWDYGPWFYPPTEITYGPVPNPYYNASDPNSVEPPMIPGVPNVSSTMEAFMDTPTVNGQAYPYINVDPQAYRFRILNAANDRFFNLQMYVADPDVVTSDGRTGTEVRMVPAVATPGYPELWPTDGRAGGVPDPALMGPDWIQIGTEGGFLPSPVVIPQQPVTFNFNPKTFTYGNVQDHSLMLGSAERADVIVDFSKYAGKTIIIYNDAPAGFPARDPRNDYFTGDGDQTASGGAPNTQAGYGPNTRTIMQIRVADKPASPAFNLAALFDAFSNTSTHESVFQMSQDPILVPQDGYDAAYGGQFSNNNYVRIGDETMTFTTLNGDTVSYPIEQKAIHDEMGGSYDADYGRMSGSLGLQVPMGTAVTQMFIPLGYASPPVDLLVDSMTALTPVMGDGTQIWAITHNGVDTHAMHWHLMNLQLINRVGWDGAIYAPDANELGWKETVRVDPLSVTIFAMRPYSPVLPWEVPASYRLIDPTMPEGEMLMAPPGGFFDPTAVSQTVDNHYVNYGWEYVWHCHLLDHEEMDMMHAFGFATAPYAPSGLDGAINPSNSTWVNMTWMDNSIGESGYRVERSVNSSIGPWTTLATIDSPHFITGGTKNNVFYYNDTVTNDGSLYYYRILGTTVIGDEFAYPVGVGYPTMSIDSAPSNLFMVDTLNGTTTAFPGAPSPPPVVTPPETPGASGFTTEFISLRQTMLSNPATSVVRTPSAPIRINSDLEFTLANGVTSGDGTALSPYIIENYTIDATGLGFGIYIANTTAHFIVRGCALMNASGGLSDWEYRPDAGLVLRNVTNGVVANNVMDNNAWAGIDIRRSQDVLVFNSSMHGNYMGIYLLSTNNSILAFNEITDGHAGIWLAGSHSNTISNNTLVRNYPGIKTMSSTWNTVLNNTIFDNVEYGVWIHAGGSSLIYHNDFIKNNGATSTYSADHVQAYDDNGTNAWDNGAEGNYWEDWTAPDVNAPTGIVDLPYPIDGGTGTTDRYPLTEQVIKSVLTSIRVTPATVNVMAGHTQDFIADGINQYGYIMPNVPFTWETNVGIMTGSQLLANTTAGPTGYVRARSGNKTGEASVTIVPGPLDHVAVTPSVLYLVRGTAQQFSAEGQDVYNNAISGLTFYWFTDVGTITSTGLFVAQQTPGTGNVSAVTDGFITGTASVTVQTGSLSYIVVSPGTVDVVAGTTQSFTATGYDIENNLLAGLNFTWSTNVGTMVGSTLTAMTTTGNGFVTASVGAVSGTGWVTVLPDALDHIDLNPAALPNMVAGAQQQFTATGKDQYNNTVPGLTFTWATDVGTITSGGLFTAQTVAGTTGHVNATAGGKVGTALVNITVGQVTYVTVVPDSMSIEAGATLDFQAFVYDQYGNPISGQVIVWSTDVGSINETGHFIAPTVSGATGVVRATVGVVNGTSLVTIVPGALDHVVISPSDLPALVVGTSQQFTAVGYDQYNNTITGLVFEWATDVGDVTTEGLFTAQTVAGVSGVVNATTGGKVGSVEISITFGLATHIVVTPGNATVVAGQTLDLSAKAYDQYGNEVLGSVFAWSTNVGTMDGSTFTAPTVSGATGNVWAAVGQVKGICQVYIDHDVLDSIVLDPPGEISAVAGSLRTFRAVGYDQYHNAITGVVMTWSTTVGSINSIGEFTAQTLAGESGEVRATNGTVGGMTNVTIVPDQLTHIVISPDPSNVTVRSQAVFTAIGYDQYDNPISGLSFVWTTDVGRMSGSTLTAQNNTGTGFVSAASGNVIGYASVTIVLGPFDWMPIILTVGLTLAALAAITVWWYKKRKG
jgi:parallel beta-helix repeat protein